MREYSAGSRYGRPFVAKVAAVVSIHFYNVVENAVDAIVAVNATLSVVFTHMTGAGGDAF